MTTAIQNEPNNATEPVLFMAFELSENTWKLGFCSQGIRLMSLSRFPE